MTFTVLNRSQALTYANQVHTQKSLLISINGTHEDLANITPNDKNNIQAVLHLQFDDVDKNQPNAMTELHAAHVAKFIADYNTSNIDNIIVHCGAGQSRSAAVCAAIMKALTGIDTDIFNNPKYTPNMHCYRLVLDAMMNNHINDVIETNTEKKIHTCIGFYTNGEYVINYVRHEDLQSNIEYNQFYRPGRAYFVDGEHVCGDMYTGEKQHEFIKTCKAKIQTMNLTEPVTDSRPYQ